MTRPWLRPVVVAGVLALAAVAVRADLPDEPPAVDQPDEFQAMGGPIGLGFRVRQQVSAERVQVGEPFTLTIRVTAEQGKLRRPRLWELESYQKLEKQKLLKVERSDRSKPTWEAPDRTIDPKTWEFDYTLTPQRAGELHLPQLYFPFWSPAGYQGTYAAGVPLTESTPESCSTSNGPSRVVNTWRPSPVTSSTRGSCTQCRK